MVNLNFGGALLVVLLIDMLLFMGQNAVDDVRGTPSVIDKFISTNTEGDLLSKQLYYNSTSNKWVMKSSGAEGQFVSASPTLTAGTGGSDSSFFVDTFTGIKNWFFDATGLNILLSVLGGPYYYCEALQLESNWFCSSIGAMWWILTLFLAIAFATGK